MLELVLKMPPVIKPLLDVMVQDAAEYAMVPEPLVYAAPHKIGYAALSALFGK